MGSLAKGVFLGFAIIFSFFQLAGFASAATIYVNGSNSGDENGTTWATGWNTIQEGINNATADDTVNVSAGTYTENVIVNVSVNLIGAGIENTIVNASNTNDHVINVSDTDYVNISGFNVTGAGITSGKAGIYLDRSDYAKIENVYSYDNERGIELYLSDNVTIANNTVYMVNNTAASVYVYGLFVKYSRDNIITNNTVYMWADMFDGSYGFYLEGSSNNILSNNYADNTQYGFNIFDDSNYNTLVNNTFSDTISSWKPKIYGFVINQSGYNVLNNNTAFRFPLTCCYKHYGIYLENASNTIISESTIYDLGYGVYIIKELFQEGRYTSRNISILKNDIHDNDKGIFVKSGWSSMSFNAGNLIANNSFSNTGTGISLVSRYDNNTIVNNTLNSSGISLSNSYYNTISKNTFIDAGISFANNASNNSIYDNLFNATANVYFNPSQGAVYMNYFNITKTLGTNIVGGPWIGGNFWAYPNGTGNSETCTDANYDGICDSSYSLESGNVDYLPLAVAPPSTLNVISPQNMTYDNGSITLNVTTGLPSNVTYSLNGTNNVSLYNDSTEGDTTITASEGLNNITVYANDSLGDYNSTTVYFTVDTITPVVFTNLTNNTYNYQNFKIEFNATDTNLESLWHDNGTGNSTYQTSNHTFTISYTSDGPKSITFYANDSAGNLNATTVLFTVESKAPAINIISPQNTSYPSAQIYLNVSADETTDSWWYQYNSNGTNITFTPNTTFFAGENGLKNITVYANDTAGNENSTTVYFTMNIPSETPPPSGGGGGGGSSGTYVLVKEILPGAPAKFIFLEGKAETAIIPEIELIANSKAYNVKITLELQKKNPTRIEPSGETYKWMSIRCSLSDRLIDEADITFKIEKQWLKENDIDPNTVTMERQISSSELESLETTKIQSNDTYVTFSAKTKGFSYFAMSGEKGSGYGEDTAKKFDPALAELMMNISKTTKPPETTLPPTLETLPPSTEETPNGGSYVLTVIILFALLALVGVGLLKRKSKF